MQSQNDQNQSREASGEAAWPRSGTGELVRCDPCKHHLHTPAGKWHGVCCAATAQGNYLKDASYQTLLTPKVALVGAES